MSARASAAVLALASTLTCALATPACASPREYTHSMPPVPGRAPGLRAQPLPGPCRTYALVFRAGDEVMSGLLEFAEREHLGASHVAAIGALRAARIAWYDPERKAYEVVHVDYQREVLSLLGDVALAEGKPQLHLHATLGGPDGKTIGGHFFEGYVNPTLEMFVTECPGPLVKQHDPELGLDLIVPNAQGSAAEPSSR